MTADYRTLAWALAPPVLVAVQYVRPTLVPFLLPVSCYLALSLGVIAHNHNHCPTFFHKSANRFFSNWISIFYGYPTFAWIPTHNMNHHKYVNRPGDATITWRISDKHNFIVASTYFFVSSYWQSKTIRSFILKAKSQNAALYSHIRLQYLIFSMMHVGLLVCAVLIQGFWRGLYVYTMACAVPALFALWMIMLFNYEQHVHTDPWSDYNHSRNWDGRVLNFLLFNNGFHAAHHEKPGVHWSRLPALHRTLAAKIDPRLIHHGLLSYFFRQYVLAPFFPALGTKQVGRAPFDPPDGSPARLNLTDIELGDAGTNAEMLRG